ncbi:MAG: SUMF1/EgtB/PvdO family nonheme iron enzyme [Ketobacter sp.]|nr:SUMF1/EgtB/PvdO family nonheme iron enzyme [Ketobacter sp.]
MTQSDNAPQDKSNVIQTTIKSLIEAFGKLPPLLGYGGLVLVLGVLILYFTGALPDILLFMPLIAIVAFLVYAYMERRFELQTRQVEQAHELKIREQEFKHTEVMTNAEPREPDIEKKETPAKEKDKIPPKEWERRYLMHLMLVCGYPPSMALVDIKEAGLGGHKLTLDRIFTSLDVPGFMEDPKGNDKVWIARFETNAPESIKLLPREPVLAVISQEELKKAVILGAPGSGKSTLINYLTLCLASDHLAGEHGVKVAVTQDHLRQNGWSLGHLRLWPVRIVLREYAARGLSQDQTIWEFIAADFSHPITAGLAGYVPLLQKRLQETGGILLLDGLDEVDKASHVRETLKTNIERFARDFRKVRILVTSRPYAYGSSWELHDFNVTQLLPFSDEQIQFFIEQWYTVMGNQDPTLGPEKAEHYSQSLVRQIEQITNLRQMARHPLLLTMMVYIHRGREGGALPQRREELYRLCVVLLLDLWRRSKTVTGQETQTLADVLGMDTERLQNALAEVALIAHRDQADQTQTADISGMLLAGVLHKHKSKESDVALDDIIEYVRDRAGLMESHGRNADNTDDIYRFPHRTFQEYLAAMHLLDAPDFPDEMVKLARQDPTRWREAVLLAGAAARPAMRWALVEALYAGKNAPLSTANDADWWGAFLAGQVLSENDMCLDPPAMHQEKITRVQAWHKVIIEQGVLPLRDRALAGQLLAALGDNRPGVGSILQDGVKIPHIVWSEEVPAGMYPYQKTEVQIAHPYRLARYPITNAQFQCFLDANDWNDARWWQGIPGDEQTFKGPRFPFANHPRVDVSWYQAVAFCRWLSDKLEEEVDLPREHEWEVAARYPDGRSYPWGNEFDAKKANVNEGDKIGQTTAVGMYPDGANPALNLYDLSGNVWEWCRNKYENPDDVSVDQSGDMRTLRGGSWGYNPDFARAAYRNYGPPALRDFFSGFRVVVRRPPSHVR